jgi:hypothetical protein
MALAPWIIGAEMLQCSVVLAHFLHCHFAPLAPIIQDQHADVWDKYRTLAYTSTDLLMFIESSMFWPKECHYVALVETISTAFKKSGGGEQKDEGNRERGGGGGLF